MATDSTETGGGPISDGNMILVVDDDERTSRLERFVLEEEGYTVACAGSGEEALKMLEANSASLVLLDILLPKMDGFTTCQKIRENSQIPIIMLTGEGRDEEKIRGLEMGADDYITKPFSVNELTARVRAVLRRSGFNRPKTTSSHTALPEPDPALLEERSGARGSKSKDAKDGAKNSVGQDENNLADQPADNETNSEDYEGSVKLVVVTTGAIKDMVDFVDALREHPKFHLLRMVSNARRDGMDVWIRLREPTPLRTTLLAAEGVTKVEAVEDAEHDPETGAETRVVKVSLN